MWASIYGVRHRLLIYLVSHVTWDRDRNFRPYQFAGHVYGLRPSDSRRTGQGAITLKSLLRRRRNEALSDTVSCYCNGGNQASAHGGYTSASQKKEGNPVSADRVRINPPRLRLGIIAILLDDSPRWRAPEEKETKKERKIGQTPRRERLRAALQH
ncbi:hypothetical protein BC826DRAFT_612443 [Russula brevipes]|nr:hypothetical protein BC826DRAFT_612443 [Russula brevipes]